MFMKHIHIAKSDEAFEKLYCRICEIEVGTIKKDWISAGRWYWTVVESFPLQEGAPINYDKMVPGNIIEVA